MLLRITLCKKKKKNQSLSVFFSASLGISVSDLWFGMASCKLHVSELKNWMPTHSRTKKGPSVGVELRVGGDPHKFEKTGWSAGGMK